MSEKPAIVAEISLPDTPPLPDATIDAPIISAPSQEQEQNDSTEAQIIGSHTREDTTLSIEKSTEIPEISNVDTAHLDAHKMAGDIMIP